MPPHIKKVVIKRITIRILPRYCRLLPQSKEHEADWRLIRPWTLVMTAVRASARAAWGFLFLMSDCSRKCSVICKMHFHLYSQRPTGGGVWPKKKTSRSVWDHRFFFSLQPSEDLCSQPVSSQSVCRPLSLITQQQTLCSCSTPKRHSATPRLCLVAAKSHFQE